MSDIENEETDSGELTTDEQNHKSEAPTHSHSHGHGHSHDHNAMGDWDILATHPLLKYILGFLGVVAFATLLGV